MIQGGRRQYDRSYLDKFLTNNLNRKPMNNYNNSNNTEINGLNINRTEPNASRKEIRKHYLDLGFKIPLSKSTHYYSNRTKQTIKQLEEKNRAKKNMIMINKSSTIPKKAIKSYTTMFKVRIFLNLNLIGYQNRNY